MIWLSDLHFDIFQEDIEDKLKQLSLECRNVVVSGDISNFTRLNYDLSILGKYFEEVFFVLGNHDFYGANNFAEVHKSVVELTNTKGNLYFLDYKEVIRLDEQRCFLGISNFADMEYCFNSQVYSRIMDFVKIGCLTTTVMAKYEINNYLSDVRKRVIEKLNLAVNEEFAEIWIFTHVPLFPENLNYVNELTSMFVDIGTGELIKKFAKENTHILFKVFSGHVHYESEKKILSNLYSFTHPNDYGRLEYKIL